MRRSLAVLLLVLGCGSAAYGGGVDPAVPGPADQASAVAHDHASHHHGPDGLDLDRGNGRKAAGAPAAPYDVDAHATWTASEWRAPTQNPTADQPDVTTLPQVHAIYVHPAKTASRLATFGAMFQADARQAGDRLAVYGRSIRWDDRTDGQLDITPFQSKYRATQLAGSNQFNLVANEIASKFNKPDTKYVVWLDAGSRYCGQGTLWADTARRSTNASDVNRTTGIVYRPYATTDPTTGGFCRGRTLLHELGHNLGAVLAPAPHSFDDAHCDDSAEDVMCYTSRTSLDSGPPVFDHGNDDYWDARASLSAVPADTPPSLPWWTVNLSRYVCPPGEGGPDCALPNSAPGY